MNDSDIMILAAIANAQSAYAMTLASNNFSLASEGHPGNDPSYILGPAYAALYNEAEARGLIKTNRNTEGDDYNERLL